MNPLLQTHPLPPFNKVKPEHVEPAMDQILAENLKEIERLTATTSAPTWESVMVPLENIEDRLHQAWSVVSHMNSVVNTPELRQAYNACLPKLSDYSTQIGQNEKLYQLFVALKESAAFASYTPAQQKIINDSLRDFKLSGVALSQEKRAQFAQFSRELSEWQSQYQDNVMDATDHWFFDVADVSALEGMPAAAIALAQEAAKKANVPGWRLTLDYPCYHAVVTYAKNRDLRQKIHEAYLTRASDIGPHDRKWDNSNLIEQIMHHRYEMAKLLDFKNYAEKSLATKMAKNTEEVVAFLKELAQKAKIFAQKEFEELSEFAKSRDGLTALKPWDLAYYSEIMRQANYAVSEEQLRAYFPVDTVLSGMFEVIHRLFGMKVQEQKDVESWHPDVRFFNILDAKNQLRGQFFLDLFARANKRNGAWMDDARSRRRLTQQIQYPIAYLTCNFQPKSENLPALLTHEEVITLFHEFGHGLHHMLTQVDFMDASGINGVAWDAVEFPSQFMENWCWKQEALTFISKHYQTQQPLSQDLLDKMLKAKNFQSAMMLMRQIEFALFDFRIHLEYKPELGARIQDILTEIRSEYAVTPIAPYNRFAHSFSHIFAGGYAAGYYSYLWAEVLAQDAFSRFEAEGIFNPVTGQEFLEAILERGGSEEPDLLFKRFRGRAAKIEPLLKDYGLIK